jgi:peptide/nickel transport system substrate-binding protein
MFKVMLLATTIVAMPWALAQAETPDRSIKIVMPIKFDNIDACNTSAETGFVVQENVTETLVQLDPKDGTPRPRLATKWEQISPTTWRVTLREGVKFHDGSAFDAKAVERALDRMFNPELDCLNRMKLFTNIKITPKVVDTHVVDLTTENPQVLMPTLLSFLAMDAPSTRFDELSNAPVGTGPYSVPPRRAGDEIVLKRFDGYWGEKPEVEQATYLQRDESALRAAMVEVGEADIGLYIASQDATNPETDFGYPNGETTRLRFVFKPPLDDIRVRKALNLAIDREALRDGLFTKDFQIATQMFLPRINGYNTDLKPWPYDPAEAKRLLDAARADGVPVDQEIPLIGRIGFYQNGQEALEAMIGMWSEVGLNIKLQMIERAQWLKLVNKPFGEDRKAMLIQEQHDNNSGDATFTMHFRYHTVGQQSEISFPELDKLLDAADAAQGEERRRLFQEANRMAAEEIVPDVMMFHMINIMRVSPRLDFRPTEVTNALFELSKIGFND